MSNKISYPEGVDRRVANAMAGDIILVGRGADQKMVCLLDLVKIWLGPVDDAGEIAECMAAQLYQAGQDKAENIALDNKLSIRNPIEPSAPIPNSQRPAMCRQRLHREGKTYPKYGCQIPQCRGLGARMCEGYPPKDEWVYAQGIDHRLWGPWIRCVGDDRPDYVDLSMDAGGGDPVIYICKDASGVGRNYSVPWEDVLWFRLSAMHSHYQ